ITAPARPAAVPVPALPAPAPQPTPLPSLAGAHVLIVGPTTTGKSNVLRQVSKGLTNSAVYAIDTNYRPGAWPATVREVVGAAGDYGRVADLMAWLDEERRSRIARYAKGDAQFNPVTLIMDEQWELANFVPAPAMATWKAVVRQGAKYGIYVVMATHSLLVKEMGLEGESSVIENFQHRIYLGPLAVERYPALDGTERPAIYMRGGSRRATPVVIPYHPEEDPRSPQFRVPAVLPAVNAGLYWNGSSAVAGALSGRAETAVQPPTPAVERPVDPRVDGLMTSRGWVGPLEVGKILEAHAAGLPHYKIEIAAFGYNEHGRPRCNGAFYHQVEEVLAFYGLSTGSTSSTGSTTP
ncbi:MAG: type IV secretory system conjugative DNA transfer family protein, partial [Candidatus Promineofilum sp.]|nr:type IV secretory system conjugative DNA transfer family protein [Promineifilum sp.]